MTMMTSLSAQSEGTNSKAGDGYHDVGTTGKLDAAPPLEPTCGLMGSGFDPASQLLLSDATDSVTNSSHADNNNGNNSVIDDECPSLTKRQGLFRLAATPPLIVMVRRARR
jgi:hypothetical protein